MKFLHLHHCLLFTIINNCWELIYQKNTMLMFIKFSVGKDNTDNITLSYVFSKESDKTINYLKTDFVPLCTFSVYGV